ncbi:MAG TPA: nuclear transport factor 2 family protein [Alphaproteobacteria bacterium]|jgi:uncharacterized protein (TIGR02246 family)|nr:nuclear transport factor 2 family protein [Alphaproteobacteria bacterium]
MSVEQQMRDEWEIRKMAMAYARTCDRGDGAGFAALFTEDAAIDGPGFHVQGYDQLLGNPGALKQMYASTMHSVMNQTVTIDGDTAEGETYCIAYHVNRPDAEGKTTRLDWAIRYQDKYVRRDGKWLYTHRQLLVEWTEVSTVTMIG